MNNFKTEIKKYKNGITLAVTNMQGFDSVAFNIFVKTGSINETEGYYGISHFIEHMLFKGTRKRSAYDISKELDSLGANVNAYTNKEETTYFFKSTLENLDSCVDVLSDMYFNSTFDKREMAREKKVVCEEISMYNDDASSKCELIMDSIFYNGTSYGLDVAGTKKSVKALSGEKIKKYMNKFYTPQNTIISFSGNITLKKAEELMQKYFLSYYNLTLKDEIDLDSERKSEKKLVTYIEKTTAKKYKDNEQAQICISYRAMGSYDKDKYDLVILNSSLGKGMSSRLFQRIREKLGLVYSIYSETNLNSAGGDLTIHFATSTNNAPLALKAIKQEIGLLVKNGLTESEFVKEKNSAISSIELSLESTISMNVSICQSLKKYNRVIAKSEMIEKLKQVTYDNVNKMFKQIFDNKIYCISYVGKNTRIDLLKNYSSDSL